ncbi:MAG TPA: hypothetical protein DCM05_11875 [Elusimicrobia bacterium]|nr:hypothetical protein [Elusimicrobiota bacterium]
MRPAATARTVASFRTLLLFTLFFLISFGYGYPVLNRYDPRKANASDAREYYRMTEVGPSHTTPYFRHRLLVPTLARPIYLLVDGRLRSWYAAGFGILIVNSVFTATSALLIMALGLRILGGPITALLASLLYLSNFCVVTHHLGSGCIDSSEACLILCVLFALQTRSYAFLPLLGALGALAKETFIPLSAVLMFTWLALEKRAEDRAAWTGYIWASVAVAASLAVVSMAESILSQGLVFPWDIAMREKVGSISRHSLLLPLKEHSFIYNFIWLLPLGLPRIRDMGRAFRGATAVAAVSAYILCVWHAAPASFGSPLPRVLFNIAGPLLTISAAGYLGDLLRLKSGIPGPSPTNPL